MLNDLKWKFISRVVLERRCLLMYRYVHNLRHLPEGFIVYRSTSNNRRSVRSNHSLALSLPAYHNGPNCNSKSFLFITTNIWNALTEEIVNVNVDVFSKFVKSRNFVNDNYVLDIRRLYSY